MTIPKAPLNDILIWSSPTNVNHSSLLYELPPMISIDSVATFMRTHRKGFIIGVFPYSAIVPQLNGKILQTMAFNSWRPMSLSHSMGAVQLYMNLRKTEDQIKPLIPRWRNLLKCEDMMTWLLDEWEQDKDDNGRYVVYIRKVWEEFLEGKF